MNRKLLNTNANQVRILAGSPGRSPGRACVACCLGALAAVMGCGPTFYIPLKPEQAAAITTTRVHATIAQEELNAAVKVANTPIANAGLIGALIGALIDTAITSHRAGEADKLVEPIRNEVSDFDFRTAFFESLKQTLPALRTLRMANLTTSKTSPTPEHLALVRARTRADTLLSLVTHYELSPDFRRFSVFTTAEISRNGQVGAEPLYRGTFAYVTEPIPGANEPEDAARAWASNHAAALHAAMREGIDETMKMLVLDLGGASVTPAQAQRAPARAPAPPTAELPTSPARVASASPTRVASASLTAEVSASPAAVSLSGSTLVSASPTAAAPASPAAAAPVSPTAAAPVAPASPTAAAPTSLTAKPATLSLTKAPASPTETAPAAPASPTAAAPTSPTANPTTSSVTKAPASPTANPATSSLTKAPASPTANPAVGARA